MSYSASLLLRSASSQQANLRLNLSSDAVNLVNNNINESSLVMEVIGGNVTGTPKRIILVDKKQFFKELKEVSGQITAYTDFTISNLVDGSKYAFEFHIKLGAVDFYSDAIEVEPHSFPLAPVIFDVTSGNNGMLVTLNTITRNTVADGFVDISNVHFVLLNVEQSSAGRDIQVTSKPFVYGTGATQSYDLRDSLQLNIENNNTYEVCAYYENEFGERSPLSNTVSVLVSPKPNQVENFAALVDDASLCIVLSWHAPEGTYTAPGAPIHAGAHTNDANVLDVDSIIDYYNITRTGPNTQVLNIRVLTASGDDYTFTYKDSASLVTGVNYVYTIVAHNKYGDGTAAPESQAPVNQTYYVLPSPPPSVTASPIPDRVSELKIQWSTPLNFNTSGCVNKDYELKRYLVTDSSGSTSLDADFNPIVDLSGNLVFETGSDGTNVYVDRSATPEVQYKYAVRFTCNNPNHPGQGFESTQKYSNPVTALDPPDSPENLGATAGDKKITYTWSAPSDNTWDADPNDDPGNDDLVIAGYSLVVKPVGGSPRAPVIIDASGSNYTYTVSGLTNGTAYVAEVASFVTSNSVRVFSAVVTYPGTQTPYGPATAITQLGCVSSTANEAKNTLTWDPSINQLLNGGDFDSYKISRTSTLDASTIVVELADRFLTSYVDSSCVQGVTYTYAFSITTKDKNNAANKASGAIKSISGMPSSQPDILDISGNGSVLTVRFYQNGSKVTSLLAVGVDSNSSNNMVKQIPNIDIPLGSTNALQSYSVTLGSPATNGGLVVIANALGFAYQVLNGTPAVIYDGSSANAPTAPPQSA